MSVAQTQRTIVKVYEYDPDFKKKSIEHHKYIYDFEKLIYGNRLGKNIAFLVSK